MAGCSITTGISPWNGKPIALSKASATSDVTAYDVLGVQRGVDGDTLKAVYKDLAREWHPDRHQGAGLEEAGRRFQEISEAYQVLSDGAKRQLLRVLDTSVAVSAADSSEEGTAVGQVRSARLWCCHDRTGSARFTRMFVRVRGCGLAERPPGVARRRATLCLHAD